MIGFLRNRKPKLSIYNLIRHCAKPLLAEGLNCIILIQDLIYVQSL